jgi:hypothetical protein
MSASRPANIPLHNLTNRRYDTPSDEASLIDSEGEKRRASADSDFSIFSEEDTGDIADQLDEEDPLQIHIRRSLEQQLPRGQRRKGGKKVRYHPDVGTFNEKRGGRLRKEDVPIPDPPRKPLSFGQRFLAAIMAPGDGPSRIHGLHGKKLMYEKSLG